MSDSTTNPYSQLSEATTYVDSNLVSSINRSSGAGKGANLDKEAFLKLLVAQMRYQDPLEPMDNSQMVAQMAQFSTLEQLMSMSSTMSGYFNYQMANSVIQYSHLIGQEVAYEMPAKAEDGSLTTEKGSSVVTGVKFDDGSVVLTLENGKDVDVGYVASIGQVSASEATEKEDGKDTAEDTDPSKAETAGSAAAADSGQTANGIGMKL